MTNDRIELAHEAPFDLGPVRVLPATREVVRGEAREVVEPRVMQVLVALNRAAGGVVSKSDLGQSCWDGRVVGEDAINRVMSRLRKLTDGIAADAFRIETVTKVGYRMIVDGQQAPAISALATTSPVGRRAVFAGGLAALATTGGGVWWWSTRNAPPAEAVALIREAGPALYYGTPEQVAAAIAQTRKATQVAPDWATAWGLLALAYGTQALQSPQDVRAMLLKRSDAAAKRALDLDPRNPEAKLANALQLRDTGRRADVDAIYRGILADAPRHPAANMTYGMFLGQVGRTRESVVHLERAEAAGVVSPVVGYVLAANLATSGRLEEGDAAMDRVFERWPRHYGVWFSRYKQFLYSDRAARAQAMLDDVAGRPTGIPQSNFDLCATETRAMLTREPAALDAAMAAHQKAAREGIGFAQNAITFASAIGRVDLAFELASAYFFDLGFKMAEVRFTREQGLFNAGRGRPSYFLFSEPFRALRADARFLTLTGALGLEAYWRASGSKPDYRA